MSCIADKKRLLKDTYMLRKSFTEQLFDEIMGIIPDEVFLKLAGAVLAKYDVEIIVSEIIECASCGNLIGSCAACRANGLDKE